MPKLLYLQCIIMSVTLIAVIAFVRTSPPYPPSPTTTLSSKPLTKKEYLSAAKILFTDVNFWLVLMSFTFSFGGSSGALSTIAYLLLPLGYTDKQVGDLSSLSTCMSVLGGALISVLLDKYRSYRAIIMCSLVGTVVAYASLYFISIPNELFYQVFCWMAIGLFGMSSIPAFLELGVECTYPVPEAISANVQLVGVSISGIVVISVCSLRFGL